MIRRHRVILAAAAALLALGGALAWKWKTASGLPSWIVEANGRIEAEEISLASKYAGRLSRVFVEEGQLLQAGDIVAQLDNAELDAEIRRAEAELSRAVHAQEQANVAIVQRESELTLAQKEYDRAASLRRSGAGSAQTLDQRRSQSQIAAAALDAARAGREQADAAAAAAKAALDRLNAQREDQQLKAPVDGRIVYRLLHTGEIAPAGAPVATMLDFTNVYMTVFLPAQIAGPLPLGSEARLILDPVPQYVIPAAVTFVSPEAQFTPKTVETKDERMKLMFRVKLSLPKALLKQYQERVKTGVRGTAYLRTKQDEPWPSRLDVKLPE